MHLVPGGDLGIDTPCSIRGHLLHPPQNTFLEVVLLLLVIGVQISLKLSIGQFIGAFVPPILRVLLLNRIVSQVNLWLELTYIELER